MDVYRPAGQFDEPLPAVLMLHGGAWISGTRSMMAPLCQELIKEEVICATASYRLAPGHRWPAMLDDSRAALRFLRDNASDYSIDPERIGVGGASAGGHLALLLGLTDDPEVATGPARANVVFNIFGPTDLTQDFPAAVANLVSMQVIGKAYAEAAEELRAFSPLSFIDDRSVPIFTIHGTADQVVPVRQAQRLDEALRAANRVHRMVLIEGMGHDINPANEEVAKAIADAFDFLKEHLAPRVPALID